MYERRRHSQKQRISYRSYNEKIFSFKCSCFRLIRLMSHLFPKAAKLANYAKYQKLCDVLFVVFSLVFFLTRLVIFPFWQVFSQKSLQPSCFTTRLAEHTPCLLQDCLQRSVRQLGDNRAVSSMVAVKWPAAGPAGSSHHLVLSNHPHCNQGYLQGKGLSLFLSVLCLIQAIICYLFNL